MIHFCLMPKDVFDFVFAIQVEGVELKYAKVEFDTIAVDKMDRDGLG